ncbi:MAG: efflux RND transporter permease subunit [Planctomycetes bacterium]|nr:efflux RND transporter permease subunit [Planctomycetota bacterium]
MKEPRIDRSSRGAISWMARNGVAANLVMVFFVAGGILMSFQVKQEVFPEVELDRISIQVPYPGASPAEVEQGIILPIEEGVRGLDGVKRVTSTASEGMGRVEIEILLGADDMKLLQDVKNEIDRIVSFPLDAERPIVSLMTNRNQVISVVVHGNEDEMTLRKLASDVREELLRHPGITLVELDGARPMEISVEISQKDLRTHALSLEDVAGQIRRSALEIPGGGVKTPGGEVLLRMAERRDLGTEFASLPLLSRADGTELKLGEVAEIIDGFADTDEMMFYDGRPAQMVVVYRVGLQRPGEIARAVRETLETWCQKLPPGIKATTWGDRSELFDDRVDLLLRNARLGLCLVLVLLGLFLEIKLAFWVTMGIPISFLGAILFLPGLDISVNMISLFAFIITLGIVVDDAIVVGENVYEFRQRGLDNLSAAIRGARQIAVPVSFSILTNMAAFAPLFFVPGTMGKFFGVIPIIVILVFAVSWIESLFVLPSHLSHPHPVRFHRLSHGVAWVQKRCTALLQWNIRALYLPTLSFCLRNRYLTLGSATAVLTVTLGYVIGERIDFTFMPRVESDTVSASATLPYGTPVELTLRVQNRLVTAAREILKANGGESISRGILSRIGTAAAGLSPTSEGQTTSGSHLSSVTVYLVPSEKRSISSAEFEDLWREGVGEIPGLESLIFTSTAGPSAQADVNVELSHPDIPTLETAASLLAEDLHSLEGVTDVDKGFSPGKPQLDFKVRPEASSLGLTASDVGRQVRAAFFGAEALRQQRSRDEIRVYVRLPEAERKSEHNVEELVIRTPRGGEVPLTEAAEVIRGRAYTVIQRADGRRAISVTGRTVKGVATPDKVIRELKREALPSLSARYPNLRIGFEGRQREQAESMASLSVGFALAVLAIFAMLAIPFRSYLQPAIIMATIPFGIVGAVLGHILMGYDLSLISLMGMVALSGVVVNDSLVLVHAVNRYRFEEKAPLIASVERGGARRFRPILLTSLTTFIGLAPMIFETSVQARFLIPMAISLGFGILFSTFIALLIVPALYVILEDIKSLFGPASNAESATAASVTAASA